MRWRRAGRVVLAGAVALALPLGARAQSGAGARTGVLIAAWDGSAGQTLPQFTLVDRAAGATALTVASDVLVAAGGLERVDRQEVAVDVEAGAPGAPLRARAIRLVRPGAARTALAPLPTGAARSAIGDPSAPALPFAVLLCRFGDAAGPLPTRAEVARMYATSYPAARHFFAEQAFGADVLAGTTVADDWVTIAPRATYVPTPQQFDYYRAGSDCADAAERAGVDLRAYYGISFQFSGPLSVRATPPFDPLSLGGSMVRFGADGRAQTFGAAWLSSVHVSNYVVVEHELGHALGWPHSEYAPNVEYDSRWDVMSYGYIGSDPAFGAVPSGTIGVNKANRGWVAGGALSPEPGTVRGAALRALARPWPDAADTAVYVARIRPVSPGCEYTVEARTRVGYDRFLPGSGVLVHQLCGVRPRLIGPPGATNDGDGAAWKPGMTFADSLYGAYARVDSATGSGYAVTVTRGWPLSVRAIAAGGARGAIAVAGVDCEDRCDVAAVSRGQTLTAAARPAPGAMFLGWEGACTGGGAECAVTMNGARELRARFGAAVAYAGASERRAAVVGVPYADTLRASGGTGTYQWAVAEGSLPDGLALGAATGVVSGTPTARGTATFVATATSLASTASVSLTLRVLRATVIASDSLRPAATRGSAYADTLRLEAEPGQANWEVVGGALPAGLALDRETGEITGTPTAEGTARFTVAGSVGGVGARRGFALRVRRPTVVVGDSLRGPAVLGIAYADTLRAEAEPGATVRWAVVEGRLPEGLTLDTAGVMKGVPTAVGTERFVAAATADGVTGTRALALAVTRTAAIVSDTLRRRAVVGVVYADTLRANAEATTSVRWRVADGALPAGVALDPATGILSGTPTAAGTARFTAAADVGGSVATRTIVLPVLRRTAVAGTAARRSAARGVEYADTLRADGESVAVSWQIVDGALPAGLRLEGATGVVRGTAEALGAARFTVRVTSELNSDTRALDLAVVEPLRIAADSLRPGGTVGEPYADTLRLGGGETAVRWTVVEGTLPPGLTLGAESGVLAGVPERGGTFAFVVEAVGWARDRRALALAVATPTVAAADVLDQLLGGGARLSPARVAYLDLAGNRNGRLDVGDVRAWLVATGALPAAAPAAQVIPALQRAAGGRAGPPATAHPPTPPDR